MQFEILTLFPDMVETVLSTSIIGRARAAGLIGVSCRQIRDYTEDKHRRTEDTLYGGGTGLLMTPQPICDCVEAALREAPAGERRRVIYMSPKGALLTQDKCAELAASYDRLILLCGHYEGVDQRALDECVDEEISIGDYVLTGGEIPACILVDAVSRLIDGVLACEESYTDESIASGLLECPHYTHPAVYRGREVPAVLLTGHHANIDKWRLEQSLALTKERRPDLYDAWMAAHPPAPPKKKRRKAPSKNGDAADPADAVGNDPAKNAEETAQKPTCAAEDHAFFPANVAVNPADAAGTASDAVLSSEPTGALTGGAAGKNTADPAVKDAAFSGADAHAGETKAPPSDPEAPC